MQRICLYVAAQPLFQVGASVGTADVTNRRQLMPQRGSLAALCRTSKTELSENLRPIDRPILPLLHQHTAAQESEKFSLKHGVVWTAGALVAEAPANSSPLLHSTVLACTYTPVW